MKCSACCSIVAELERNLETEKPRMNVDLRNTLSGGKQGKVVDYAVSELRTLEVLEAVCPAMTHYDRSSRPQTVAAADDAWLHALLLAVAARTRCEALINTSFNARGRPILNTIADALGLLRTDDDLDYVLVDDWLFAKRDDLAAAVVELSGVDAGRGHL